MGYEFWIAVAASIGTIASAFIAGIAIKQNNISEHNYYAYHFSEKMEAWYKETLQIMKDLFYLTDTPENAGKKDNLLSHLSANIDVGRGFFKNVEEDIGLNKPDIYKGKRTLVLSLLVMFHHMFEQNLNIGHYGVLRNIERAFVSEITTYDRKLQCELKLIPYELTDDLFLLEAENINNDVLYPIYENEDIIKYVKLANNYFKTLPEKTQKNISLSTNDRILASKDFLKYIQTQK